MSHPEDVVTYGGEETQGHRTAPTGHEARLRACLPILQKAGKVNPDRGILGSWGMDFYFYFFGGKFLLYLRHFEKMLVYMSETR